MGERVGPDSTSFYMTANPPEAAMLIFYPSPPQSPCHDVPTSSSMLLTTQLIPRRQQFFRQTKLDDFITSSGAKGKIKPKIASVPDELSEKLVSGGERRSGRARGPSDCEFGNFRFDAIACALRTRLESKYTSSKTV